MKSSTVLQKYDYSYGTVDLGSGTVDTTKNNGQLGKIEGFIGANKQWSQRFGYDELGRLKEAREYLGDNSALSYKQVFDFDRFGNLYRKTSSNPTAGQEDPLPYTPIEDSDISKSTNRFISSTTYDEAGAVVNDPKFRSMGFAYDANGRMVKATKTGTPDAWTVYDALGNRVAAKVNDIWRFMIYDAFGKLVAEYGQADEGVGGVSYIQQDWQGSVRTVSNSNGFVISRTDHQAFGEPIAAGVGLRSTAQGYYGTVSTRQGYGLTETDDATGLNHTWFRKQENQAGRWTSPDPYNGSMALGNPQSFNRYSYVENQPTNYVDPSGLLIYPEAPYDPVLVGRGLIGGLTWALATGGLIVRFYKESYWDGGLQFRGLLGIWFYPGQTPSNSSECPIPGIPCVQDMLKEAKQWLEEKEKKRKEQEKCLQDAFKKLEAGLAEIAAKYPFDSLLLKQAINRALVASSAGAGAPKGRKGRVALIAAAVGALTVVVEQLTNRGHAEGPIQEQFIKDVKDCGAVMTPGGPMLP